MMPMRLIVAAVSLACLAAACGGSEPDPMADPGTTRLVFDDETSVPESTIDTSPSTAVTTSTAPTTTSTTAPVVTTADNRPGFAVVTTIDRDVDVATVVVADSSGNILATLIDDEGVGCEGTAPHYYATQGADGTISPVTISEEPRLYTGFAVASPSRTQVLDIASCEGFLGSVTLYELDGSLRLRSPIDIDITGAVSGDAGWTADGFVTMFLAAEYPGFAPDPDDSDSGPAVTEYLVNPRTGERTRSGQLDEFYYGTTRLPDGRLIFVNYAEDPEVSVAARNGSIEQVFPASDYAVSPDATKLLMWDSVFDASPDISIDLVDLETGQRATVGAGSSLRAVWNDDSTRVAFSNGLETHVYDLNLDEWISVGEAEPLGCEDDGYVVWGRVPLAFGPNGDLYVGDALCGVSSDGFPFEHFALHQISLS